VNALPDLYPFFEWCDNTRVGAAIRDSRFLFPLIETIHLFALTILLGTVIVVGVRMMRISLRRESLAELTAGLLPWTNGSIAVMLATGVLLFLSEALKCYGSASFRAKMVLLAAALVFHVTVFRRLGREGDESFGALAQRTAGIAALALWFGVGLAGRGIAFLE
jgi:hypothetical protein